MGYKEALEAAGANVIAMESFGSYQGEWIAKVGDDAYICGSYGSCTGCDAFEAEFGLRDDEHCEEHRYGRNNPVDCQECAAAKVEFKARLKSFGESYLGTECTKAALVKSFTEQAKWDSGAAEALAWLEAN